MPTQQPPHSDETTAGDLLPDLELPDHTGRTRLLSEIAGGDPLVVVFFRGWWCPKDQRYFRELVALQDEIEVGYARLVAVSVDPPEVQSAFRAGLGARFAFLSDAERTYRDRKAHRLLLPDLRSRSRAAILGA